MSPSIEFEMSKTEEEEEKMQRKQNEQVRRSDEKK